MQRQLTLLSAASAAMLMSGAASAATGAIQLCNLAGATQNYTNGYTTGLSGPHAVAPLTCGTVTASFPSLTTYSGHFVSVDIYDVTGRPISAWNCTFYVSTVVSGGKCNVQLSSTLKGQGGGCSISLDSQNQSTCDFSGKATISGP